MTQSVAVFLREETWSNIMSKVVTPNRKHIVPSLTGSSAMTGSPIGPRVPIEELGVEYPSLASPVSTGCDRMLRRYVELFTAIGPGNARCIDWVLRIECIECTDSNVFDVTTLDRDCVDPIDCVDSIDSWLAARRRRGIPWPPWSASMIWGT